MGQQGKFLLNKASYSMPWKNNIMNTNERKSIFFKSLLISYIFEFLIKNSIYINFLKRKKQSFLKKKNFIQYYPIVKSNVRKLKKFSRKIFFSQLSLLYFNTWFVIKLYTFIIFRNKTNMRSRETFFRLRHSYYYYTPDLNKF